MRSRFLFATAVAVFTLSFIASARADVRSECAALFKGETAPTSAAPAVSPAEQTALQILRLSNPGRIHQQMLEDLVGSADSLSSNFLVTYLTFAPENSSLTLLRTILNKTKLETGVNPSRLFEIVTSHVYERVELATKALGPAANENAHAEFDALVLHLIYGASVAPSSHVSN